MADLVVGVTSEAFGLGPLDMLLGDPEVSDILVNRWDEVFVERNGQLQRTDICFGDDGHVLRIIQRVAAQVGRRLDESSPVVDARLPDGSRVHAVVPPLAVRGPTLSIRRFKAAPLSLLELRDLDSVNSNIAEFLAAAVCREGSILYRAERERVRRPY